jgi:putative DNA primase/helicase
MADFARWVVAAEPALPWKPGDFIRAYAENRDVGIIAMLDGDPLADMLRGLTDPTATSDPKLSPPPFTLPWDGPAKDLLAELNARTPLTQQRRKGWHTSPRHVADHLRRLAPALRRMGISVVWPKRGNKERKIFIDRQDKRPQTASSSSPSSPSTDLFAFPRAAVTKGDEV